MEKLECHCVGNVSKLNFFKKTEEAQAGRASMFARVCPSAGIFVGLHSQASRHLSSTRKDGAAAGDRR